MRPLARWGSLPLLATPVGTWALGLGEIELHSALNQPLDAEIELVSATADELATLQVSLAPVDSFERYGLDRPAFLASVEFEVGRSSTGADIIRVSSPVSISEPFVTMLVEAEWGRGRLLREYTVFLDPPVLLPSDAPVQPVAPAQTRAPQTTATGGAISRTVPAQTAPAQPAAVAPPSTPLAADGTTFGPVQDGQTLWSIASTYAPAGTSVNQAMVAIYRANPEAFGGNMNLLRRGAILRIPPGSSMSTISGAEAAAEVRRQGDAWSPGAGAPAETEERLVLVPPTEVSSGAGAGVSPQESPAEVDALRSQVESLQQQLNDQERLLEVRNQEFADLQNQLATNIPADEATVEASSAAAADPGRALESEQLFVDEAASATDSQSAAGPIEPLADELTDAQPLVEASATETEQTPVQTAAPSPQTAPTLPAEPAPTLVDRIIAALTSTTALIGGGIVLILIGALMFMRRRKDDVEDATGQWEALEADLDQQDEDVAATARLRAGADDDSEALAQAAAPPAHEAEAGDATGQFSGVFEEPGAASEAAVDDTLSSQTLSSQTVINLDQADPIAEADFHMAYGLYDQAADLVSKALEADPDNKAYRLKLLEVFFVWGNKDSFLESARALKADVGETDSDWAKVIIMGKQICPDDELFADAQAAAGNVDVDLEAGDAPGLDFAFDEQEASEPVVDLGAADDSVDLDFGDLAGEDNAGEEATQEIPAVSSAGLAAVGLAEFASEDEALDIGERTQAGLEAALFEVDEEAEKTSPGASLTDDLGDDSSVVTQESPTIESPAGGGIDLDLGTDMGLSADDLSTDDVLDITAESPTVDSVSPADDDAPTMEMLSAEAETVESAALAGSELPTVETPTLESPMADLEADDGPSVDPTAELDLGDLGLDVSDIEGLDAALGENAELDDESGDTQEQPQVQADDALLSATGVTQVLTEEDLESHDLVDLTNSQLQTLGDSDETQLAPGFDDRPSHADTEIISRPEEMEQLGAEETIDIDLDDFSEALEGSDTVEQPRTSDFDDSFFADASDTPIDLDVGVSPLGSDDPTGTDGLGPLDAQTMTEVGTKLDLARAYIDMGDPEGAKSILEEVLSEGDNGQREEAQSLIDALPA